MSWIPKLHGTELVKYLKTLTREERLRFLVKILNTMAAKRKREREERAIKRKRK